ncbi:MAG: N-formylglutamate amidohydrolase, partial [Acetobacteraceae bacterium]|nr:N-formylglutamate amidohydrolase [Acetobacteraceae bacterium]
APYRILRPAKQTAPVVFASPHSGRNYPHAFLEAARLDAAGLRRSEDCFVDELFEGAIAAGAPLVAAQFARAYCDPNREQWELDPAMFLDTLPDWVNTTSARVGAGLGTLARVVASGETIYRRKLSFREAEFRVRTFWQPYHAALRELLDETRRSFGACLLIDCHSMPAQTQAGGRPSPDIVLGDAHGTACSPSVMRAAEVMLTDLGFRVRRNDPYAGGYVTRHYGRPRERIHAIQIELARGLYMDEARLLQSVDFPAVRQKLTEFATRICAAAPDLLDPEKARSPLPG